MGVAMQDVPLGGRRHHNKNIIGSVRPEPLEGPKGNVRIFPHPVREGQNLNREGVARGKCRGQVLWRIASDWSSWGWHEIKKGVILDAVGLVIVYCTFSLRLVPPYCMIPAWKDSA